MSDVTTRQRNEAAQIAPRLLPAKLAATYLGLPYTSLRAEVFAGRLPVLRRGRAWYFSVATLDRFIHANSETYSAIQ